MTQLLIIFGIKKETLEFLKNNKNDLEFNLEEVKIDGFQLYYAKLYLDEYGSENKI